ncbi:hypothetical protein IMY05_003G0150900 [Salix suchowensis]|nr:hypothetical protein IMY05_003G0150900 [Salix suchowensis]
MCLWNEFDEIICCHLVIYISAWKFHIFFLEFVDQFVFDCNSALNLDPHYVLNWLEEIFAIYKHLKCLGYLPEIKFV